MVFSRDLRFLVCQNEDPEFKFVFIDLLVIKNDIAEVQICLTINRISISPKDNPLFQLAIQIVSKYCMFRKALLHI